MLLAKGKGEGPAVCVLMLRDTKRSDIKNKQTKNTTAFLRYNLLIWSMQLNGFGYIHRSVKPSLHSSLEHLHLLCFRNVTLDTVLATKYTIKKY